ncbi:MAG: hypothetical protein ACRBI6_22030 [Acidimicrobiales bacterium]
MERRGTIRAALAVVLLAAGCGGSSDGESAPTTTDKSVAELTSAFTPVVVTDPGGLAPGPFIDLGTNDEVDYVDTMAGGPDGAWVTVLGDRDNDSPNRAVLVDPQSGDVSIDAEVPDRPGAIAASAGAAWVYGFADDSITRVDAASGETTPIDGAFRCVAAHGSNVWVGGETVVQLDPTTGEATGVTAIGDAAAATDVSGTVPDFAVEWLADGFDGTDVSCSWPLALSETMLWIADSGLVFGFDPESGRAQTVVGTAEMDIEAAVAVPGGLWVFGDVELDDDVKMAWLITDAGEISAKVDIEHLDGSIGQATTDGTHLFLDLTDDPADGAPTTSIVVLSADDGSDVASIAVDAQHYLGLATAGGKVFITTERPYGIQIFE